MGGGHSKARVPQGTLAFTDVTWPGWLILRRIRYRSDADIHQGAEKIKVRDFQNLIGRAGRSGMHTEGLVIFSDPAVYDKRQDRKESWKFSSSVELLSPDRSESTTSSLLGLLGPFRSIDGKGVLELTSDSLCGLILSDEDAWLRWANEVVRRKPKFKSDAKALVGELRRRRSLIFAIESYLMANRGSSSFNEFRSAADKLATATLAHHLASDNMQPGVRALFVSVADYLQEQEPAVEKQAAYAKTLLGVKSAKAVEQWVITNREFLLTLNSNEDWLAAVWGLFSEQSDDKFFHAVEPTTLAFELVTRWLQGSPYSVLFAHSSIKGGSKPWGEKKRRRVTEDEIVDFCESTIGFECSLILAAYFAERDRSFRVIVTGGEMLHG